MKEETFKCSICRAPSKGFGNNAWPINEGRCCDSCNGMVIVARINDLERWRKDDPK